MFQKLIEARYSEEREWMLEDTWKLINWEFRKKLPPLQWISHNFLRAGFDSSFKLCCEKRNFFPRTANNSLSILCRNFVFHLNRRSVETTASFEGGIHVTTSSVNGPVSSLPKPKPSTINNTIESKEFLPSKAIESMRKHWFSRNVNNNKQRAEAKRSRKIDTLYYKLCSFCVWLWTPRHERNDTM